MTPPVTLADLRAAMRSAKACGEHARYRDPQGAEGAAAVFAPDCDACADAVALAVAERVREACAVAAEDTEDTGHGQDWELGDSSRQRAMCAAAIREWRPT